MKTADGMVPVVNTVTYLLCQCAVSVCLSSCRETDGISNFHQTTIARW